MLTTLGSDSARDADVGPGERFEVWRMSEASRLATRDRAGLESGFNAGLSGAPCPGSSCAASYRLGWEVGATYARRVPEPAWMRACGAQVEHAREASC